MAAHLSAIEAAVVSEAMKKSGLIWLRIGESRAQPVWHLWHDEAAYVLHGGDEQPAAGLSSASTVEVAVRSKDNGGRLLVWAASVTVLDPADPQWQAVVALLAAKRLNAVDGPAAPDRWAATCTVSRLTPVGALVESWSDPATGSGAAEAPDTPATPRVPLPSWFGRRRPRR